MYVWYPETSYFDFCFLIWLQYLRVMKCEVVVEVILLFAFSVKPNYVHKTCSPLRNPLTADCPSAVTIKSETPDASSPVLCYQYNI